MKIGLISDTRVSNVKDTQSREVNALTQVVKAFEAENVELILHAGGINTPDVLDLLEAIAPVKAAGRVQRGHAESPQPSSLEGGGEDSRVQQQHILEIEGHRIALINEFWLPWVSDELMPGAIGRQNLAEGELPKLVEDYIQAPVDIVVFGRTLHALIEEHQGVMFINPGSPSLPRALMKLGQVAVLELTETTRSARLIELSEYS